MSQKRERFSSNLGFLLVSAGCAVGLGNVWRFPSITGEYGGAAFILLYLLFLLIFGLPIMAMEFSVGRASQRSVGRSFDNLEPAGTKWHCFKWFALAGNVLLMMFYTVVTGWMLAYLYKMIVGDFNGLDVAAVGSQFTNLLADPLSLVSWMVVACALGMAVCALGVQKGIERITKVMMASLFVIMIVLCVRAVTLDGAADGLAFYLLPDFSRMFADGWTSFGNAVYAAMGQSFFTLSIGIGSMAIFGSYLGKEKGLYGESMRIVALDTSVALMAGLIIFPACFAFGVSPDAGPSLVFVTLPNVFQQMPAGQLWGALFFLFLSFAALSTVIAVFENILSFCMDEWGWSRKRAVSICFPAIVVLSLPCALGFNVWSGVTVPGIGDIQSVEDFIVSQNLLPLGSLVFVLFCTMKKGWGWKNFLAEADAGDGPNFPRWLYGWMRFGVPVLLLVIFVMGYLPMIQKLIA